MLDKTTRQEGVRELPQITLETDTRDYLARAARQARAHDKYELIVDVDAHLHEGGFWGELLDCCENEVLRRDGKWMLKDGVNLPLVNVALGISFQAMQGRVPSQTGP